ncbi:MAG TPA: hypothetical protein VJH03_14035 [Blastocatellia bacterium]|nr:hypothetical protein [Blastocatellia bacterium]
MVDLQQAGEDATVAGLPNFPFETYPQLQQAVRDKSFKVGVDSLAAAEWSNTFNTRAKKTFISALSLLLLAAAVASMAVTVWLRDYWLLAAVPIQALSFYLSQPASRIRKWVTAGGAAAVVVFADLVVMGHVTSALLVAYAGLTFAAVRAAGSIANSSFRAALMSDEVLFVSAFRIGACTILEKTTSKVYAHRRASSLDSGIPTS